MGDPTRPVGRVDHPALGHAAIEVGAPSVDGVGVTLAEIRLPRGGERSSTTSATTSGSYSALSLETETVRTGCRRHVRSGSIVGRPSYATASRSSIPAIRTAGPGSSGGPGCCSRRPLALGLGVGRAVEQTRGSRGACRERAQGAASDRRDARHEPPLPEPDRQGLRRALRSRRAVRRDRLDGRRARGLRRSRGGPARPRGRPPEPLARALARSCAVGPGWRRRRSRAGVDQAADRRVGPGRGPAPPRRGVGRLPRARRGARRGPDRRGRPARTRWRASTTRSWPAAPARTKATCSRSRTPDPRVSRRRGSGGPRGRGSRAGSPAGCSARRAS